MNVGVNAGMLCGGVIKHNDFHMEVTFKII